MANNYPVLDADEVEISLTSFEVSAGVHAPARVTVNSAGAELFTSGNPGYVGWAQTLDSTNDNIAVEGMVAHDAADSGKPLKAGAKATTSVAGQTAVANNDRTHLYAGIDGVLIVRPLCNLEDILTPLPVAITDGSSTSVIAALGAGVKAYVTKAIVSNSSTSDVTVDIRNGAAGAVRATLPVPGNAAGGVGGFTATFDPPLPFSANTAVCADPSAAASTITVTLLGFRSAV
jgi:hypothetical protein